MAGTHFDDINWEAKREKWDDKIDHPRMAELLGEDYRFVGRPGFPGGSEGETGRANGDESRFDAVETFNNDYDVRTFLSTNPRVREQLEGGIVNNAADMNYVQRAMERMHSKPVEQGGLGHGGSFSSVRDYAQVAQRSLDNFFDDLVPKPEDQVKDIIDENLPDPWWKDENPERDSQVDEAERIVSERNERGKEMWSGDKYDARSDKSSSEDDDDDMYDSDKDEAAFKFLNDRKTGLLGSTIASMAAGL